MSSAAKAKFNASTTKPITAAAAKGGALKVREGSWQDDLEALDDVSNEIYQEKNTSTTIPKDAFVAEPSPREKADVQVRDIAFFKKSAREAVLDWCSFFDDEMFAKRIENVDRPVFHPVLVATVVRCMLDQPKPVQQRMKHLFLLLNTRRILTASQLGSGLRQLYYQLDDLLLDYPDAHHFIKDCAKDLVDQNLLDSSVVDQLESQRSLLKDSAQVAKIKSRISEIVHEYLYSEIFDGLHQQVQDVDQAMHFEIAKQLISVSLDLHDRQRELTSVALAELVGIGALRRESLERGIQILLERVEDLQIDVPDAVNQLSQFIARAVVDEAVSPAFLVTHSLHENDLGFEVLRRSSNLLKQPKAGAKLAACWGFLDVGDEDIESVA